MRICGTRLRRGVRRSAVIAVLAAGLLAPPPPAAQVSLIPPELPLLVLEQVTPRSGNNPFDARDPMAADANAISGGRR